MSVIDRYKFVLQLVWNIVSKPDASLSYDALLNAFYGKNVFKNFIIPLAEILCAAVFISSLFHSEINVAEAIVKSIFNCLSFVAGYGVLFLLVRWITLRYFVDSVNDRNVYLLVGMLMSIVFLVNLFLSLFPNLFFINFLYVYLFYLVWVMSEGIIDIAEEMRNKYMCVVSILVFVIPFIINVLLKQMVPNL